MKLLLFVLFTTAHALDGIVDLTWDFNNETLYWTGVRPFSYTKVVETKERGFWYAAKEFCAGEHGGTHFDAPYHFNENGWKVAEIPIDRLIAKGAMLDLTGENEVTVQHLENWIQRNGNFEDNTVLLVKFGNSVNWGNRPAYMRTDAEGKSNFPAFSADAARWIADSGKIVGVGLDAPSADLPRNTDAPVHRILLGRQIYILENVRLLDYLPEKGFTIFAFPMKMRDGSGAPVRILAVPSFHLYSTITHYF